MNWKLIRFIDAWFGIPFLYLLRMYRKVLGRGPRVKRPDGGRNILLVKFWGIGNVFMLVPSANALRKRYPASRLDFLTLETNREAADTLGLFDHTYALDTGNFISFIRTCVVHYRMLSRQNYDLIIDFEQFARFSAIFCALIGRGITIGFDTDGQHRHGLYRQPVRYSNTRHVARSFFSLAVQGGVPDADYPRASLSLGQSLGNRPAREILRELSVPSRGRVMVMHMGTSSNFSERRWPARHYARLINYLAAHYHISIVCTGLKEEGLIFNEVIEQVFDRDAVVNAMGRLDFSQFFDLIRASDFVISADTSAVHMASALGIPVIGLYGPNTPLLYGPWGRGGTSIYSDLPCSPCITNFNAKTHDCRHPEGKGACMKRITAEEVYVAVRARLADAICAEGPARNEGAETCIL